MTSASLRRAVRSSGSSRSGRPDGTCAVGVRQLRRKRPAGGGSVPESAGAAANEASAFSFARLVRRSAGAAPSGVAAAGAAIGSKSSAGATAEGPTVELLLPMADAAAAVAAASLLASLAAVAANVAFARAAPLAGLGRGFLFICRAQAS